MDWRLLGCQTMKLYEMIREYLDSETLNRESLSSFHQYLEDNHVCPHQEVGMSESHANGDIVGLFVSMVAIHKCGWPEDLHDILYGG